MIKFLLLLLCATRMEFCWAQAPGVRIEKFITPYAFPTGQVILDAKKTPDGGYIAVGSDSAFGFNDTLFASKTCYAAQWIVKTDSVGNVQWNYSPPRSTGTVDYASSAYTSVILTSDGGYVAAGYTPTTAFQPSTNNFLITKFAGNGAILWNKTYGGTGADRAYSIIQASNGNYVVTGVTNSNNGNVSGNHGSDDIWMIALNGLGDLLWQKCLGGSGSDLSYDIAETDDNALLLVGITRSFNGDFTGNNGNRDAWVMKTDLSGTIIWQKNYGGSSDEGFKDVILNSDGSFTAVGFTASSSVEGYTGKGGRDLWLIKASAANGNLIWSKGYGGLQNDEGVSVDRTLGNGYLIGGYTRSVNGDVSFNHGSSDAWLLKLSSEGNLLWETTAGTSSADLATVAIYKSESDYVLFGTGNDVFMGDLGGYFVRFGNTNRIKGTLYFDANSNGVKDAGENYFNDAVVKVSGAVDRAIIPVNGFFQTDVVLGSYNTTVQLANPYFVASPASITSTNFTTYFNTDSISFAIQPIPNKKDLAVSLVPLSVSRPGFATTYQVVYRNVGTTTITNGEVLLKKDSRLNFSNAIPAVTTLAGDTLKWSYSNLAPSQSVSITVRFQVQAPPAVNNGDVLTSMAIITPTENDETPLDDTAVLRQIVQGAVDPNDKIEAQGGKITSSFVAGGQFLQYTIRFQNTGNDTAFNVVVRDTLDTRLDWGSLQMVAASHPYTLSITGDNKLAWEFGDILLPDSNINEPASHGYISYRIKPKATVVNGQTINNSASIYFDFNLPVMTNNASTLVQDNFVVLPVTLLKFTGELGGKKVRLYWETGESRNFDRFEIERSIDGRNYSKIGIRSLNNAGRYNLEDDIALLSSTSFYYRLKMVDLDGKSIYSHTVLLKVNPVAGAVTIYPNPTASGVFASFHSSSKERLQVRVFDLSGRMVLQQYKEIQPGSNVVVVSTQSFTSGIYSIQLIQGQQFRTATFQIVR